MKQEYKDLLLKDLCARLPYGVKLDCKWKTPGPNGNYCMVVKMNSFVLNQIYHIDDTDVPFNEVKPYLFPLSSMSREQKEELENLGWYFDNFEIHNVSECLGTYREYVAHSDCFVLIDWFNKNHFDYRGLIEKGLAIDCTNLNIY